ncbi:MULTISPECIES: SMI1/KNR4 family protein [Morganella]|uniref:SMI1/KNR4 family protein n=1 Tax=Morganella TaxID=581 RepID=UPI001C41DB09|nr:MULTISPECIES: SMI1/KNR4 family protein [Morganella]ELA9087035.1 SMI1/KNR4 family protein [Morganella morganii]MCU6376725.1 SMI1/KNR4 family protein [Morganella morganii]MDH0354497.1 SMI1/KNR4 family protein [Morganella sp. GD04133]HBH7051109.1 SMI1/KNR4 family protein [Morganella morganii]
MKKLAQQIVAQGADTRPVNEDEIITAEQALGIQFSPEYKAYLSEFGLISSGAAEVYGLGVPATSHLNILSAIEPLREGRDYPPQAVPLYDIGDGYYYLYDNKRRKILTWSMINGVVDTSDEDLEAFLLRIVFHIKS